MDWTNFFVGMGACLLIVIVLLDILWIVQMITYRTMRKTSAFADIAVLATIGFFAIKLITAFGAFLMSLGNRG